MEKQKESNLHQPLFFGGKSIKATHCHTCRFAWIHNPPKKLPENGYCKIYESLESKPEEVLFDGAPCEYYEPDKGKFEK